MNSIDELYVTTLVAGNFTAPSNSVSNAAVAAAANIDADKLEHLHRLNYSQNSTVAAATIAIHLAEAAGTIRSVRAGNITACAGNASYTVDVKKNGTTCLSSVIGASSTLTAYSHADGTLSVTDLAADDVLTVVVAVNAGTGTLGTGLYVGVEIDEAAN